MYSPINLKAKLALSQIHVSEGSWSPGTTRFTEKTNGRYVAFACRGPYNNPDVGKAAAVFSPFSEKAPEGQRRTVTYLSLLSKWKDWTSNPVLLVESKPVLFPL